MIAAILLYFSLLFYGVIELFRDRIYQLSNFFFVLILSLIAAFRWDVGNDFMSYHQWYNTFEYSDISFSIFSDSGFLSLLYVGKQLRLSSAFMFGASAFLGWGLIAFRYKSNFSIVFTVLLLGEFYFWSHNGLRQFIAIAFFTLFIHSLDQKQVLWSMVYAIFGTLFHSSFIFMVPIAFLLIRINPFSFWIYVVLYLVSLVVGLTPEFIEKISELMTNFYLKSNGLEYYGRHLEKGRIVFAEDFAIGVGYLLNRILDIIILYYLIKRRFELKSLSMLSWFGLLFFNLFLSVQVLLRISIYFVFFKYVLLAFMLLDKTENKLIKYVSISVLVALFISAIINGSNMNSPFTFRI